MGYKGVQVDAVQSYNGTLSNAKTGGDAMIREMEI